MVNPNSEAQNVDPDQYGNADFTDVTVTVSNLVTQDGSQTIASSNVSVSGLGAIESGGYRDVLVKVNIPAGQANGDYYGWMKFTSVPGGSEDSVRLRVVVGPVEHLHISGNIDVTVGPSNDFTNTDTFKVVNTGNDTLTNIVFQVPSMGSLGSYTFFPQSIPQLAPGESTVVEFAVHINYGVHEGVYHSTVRVKDDDGYPWDTTTATITVLPFYDLDVADNAANVVGGVLALNNVPGASDSGLVRVVNPNSEAQNVDPDQYGNADFTNVTVAVSNLVTQDGTQTIAASNVSVSGLGAIESGGYRDVLVKVSIPAGQANGDYYGWLKFTSVPGGSEDSVRLRVVVGPQKSLDITTASISVTGDHNSELTVSFNVTNDGNTPLYGIQFNSTNLVYDANNVIPATNVTFEPNMISSLGIGQTATVTVHILVPLGTYAQTYTGNITAYADGGFPADNVTLNVTVNPTYDLDISDNEQNLVGNTMSLSGGVGETVTGYFRLINPNAISNNVDEEDGPGNADLSGLSYTVSDLTSGSDVLSATNVTLVGFPTTLNYGQAVNIPLRVSIPSNQATGTYTGWVKVTDTEGGVPVSSDSFQIVVAVGSVEDIDIAENSISVSGNHGAYTSEATFTVWNTDATHNPDADGPGNSDLYNIEFYSTKLSDGHGHEIAGNLVHFTPPTLDMLASGNSATIHVYVDVPQGTYAGTYEGTITARDNDGWPSDTVHFVVTVNEIADLDIADNLENLSANTMNLNGQQGQTVNARFAIYNPNRDGNNVDPGDGPGNVDLNNLVFEPIGDLTDNVGHTIPAANITSNVPTTLASGAYFSATLTVAIPANQPSGMYEGLVRVYDAVKNVADTFMLKVNVGVTEDIDIENTLVQGSGNHGQTVTLSNFVVWNTDPAHNPDAGDGPGNVAIDNIRIEVTNLYSGTYVIPSSAVTFNPNHIGYLPIGANDTVTTSVSIPYGQHAGTYTGVITVYDDDGYPSDTVSIQVTVNPEYDLDIADNEGNLTANMMTLSGDLGDTVHGVFQLINPNSEANNADPDAFGNADLNAIAYSIDTLWSSDHLSYIAPANVTINGASALISGASDLVDVYVNIPSDQPAGVYQATLRAVDAAAAVGDSFTVKVVVGRVEDIDIENTLIAGSGGAQDTLVTLPAMRVWNPSATSSNPDPDGPGNVDLGNIQFSVTNLVSADNRVIPSANVEFYPQFLDTLISGTYHDVVIKVRVAPGTHEGVYVGTINVHDDDGTPDDNVPIRITITPSYDMDVAQSNVNLGSVALGSTANGIFRVVNPNSQSTNVDPDPFGNADLDSVIFSPTNLVFAGKVKTPGAKAVDSVITNNRIQIATITNLESGAGVDWPISVTVPHNVVAGTYQGMVYAYAIHGTDTVATDSFSIELSVKAVENIRIVESTIADTTGHGGIATMTFHVLNVGNVDISDITFENTDFVGGSHVISAGNVTFDPTSISIIRVGDTATVTVNVNVPLGTYATDYTGTIRVTTGSVDDDVTATVTVTPSYDLDIQQTMVNLGSGQLGATVSGQFRAINPNSAAMNVDPDMFGNADLDSVTFTVPADLRYSGKIKGKTLVDSTISASNVVVATIPGIESGDGVDWNVAVTIPSNVLAGTYEGEVIAHAYANGAEVSTDTFGIELTVKASPAINVVEDTVSATTGHGSVATMTFTVSNVGNVDLTGITFGATNFVGGSHVIPAGNVTFEPTNIALLRVDNSATVTVRVNVPLGTYATTYYGVVRVGTGEAEDTVVAEITVTPSYDLDIADNEMNLTGNTMSYSGNVGETVSGLHFKVINPNSAELNVDPDPFGNADLTSVTATATDLASSDGFTIPASNVQITGLASTIASGSFTIGEVSVTIPANQVSGTYNGKVIVTDNNSGVADTFDLVVNVMPHEVVDITADSISLGVLEGKSVSATIYVKNTGNIDLKSLQMKAVSDLVSGNGVIIPRSQITFTKSVIDSIARGDSVTVTMRIDVPKHEARGTYTGWIAVMGANGTPTDSAKVVLEVKSNEAISFDNNPVTTSSVKIGYTGDVGYRPTLTIMNMAADIVLNVKLPAITGNNDVYVWRLTNAAGKAVAPGLYIVMLKTKENGTIKVYRSKLLIVR